MFIETLKKRLVNKHQKLSIESELVYEEWTIVEVPLYTSGQIGSKPEIHRYLKKHLGKGEVCLYPSGIVQFKDCDDLEKNIFAKETDENKLEELAKYITTNNE